MGCFNVNCAVSGLNIRADEEVVVIPVFNQCLKSAALTTYINEKQVFIPCSNSVRRTSTEQYGVPFRACYNEYGWFYFSQDKLGQYGWTWLIEHIMRCNIRVPADPSMCRKTGFEPSRLRQENAVEELMNGIFDKSVFVDWMQVYKHSRNPFAALIYSVDFVFVKSEVFEYIKLQNSTFADFLQNTITEFLNKVYDTVPEFNAACLIEDPHTRDHTKANVLMSLQLEYSRFGDVFYSLRAENPLDFVTGKKDSLADFECLLQGMKDIAVLMDFMEGIGRKLAPVTSMGQFGKDKILLEFNEFVSDLIQSKKEIE